VLLIFIIVGLRICSEDKQHFNTHHVLFFNAMSEKTLIYPKEGNTIVQVEQRFYRSFTGVDFRKYRLTIYKIQHL
jgi:hypothetical protein